MTPIGCDVLVVGSGAAGTIAAVAAARHGARTMLVDRSGRLGGAATAGGSTGHGRCQDRVECDADILRTVFDEMAHGTSLRLLLHSRLTQVTRRGRTITSVALLTGSGPVEVRARLFVDASDDLDLLARVPGATDAHSTPRRITGLLTLTIDDLQRGAEFIDTMALGAGADRLHALPYRIAVPKGLDNALAAGRGLSAEPEAYDALSRMPTILAVAQAVGTAAALLAASGQPAPELDPATLREKLRDAGAIL